MLKKANRMEVFYLYRVVADQCHDYLQGWRCHPWGLLPNSAYGPSTNEKKDPQEPSDGNLACQNQSVYNLDNSYRFVCPVL